jgi:hypothetical protein
MGWLLAILLEVTLDVFPFVSPHRRWTPWIVGLVWLGALALVAWGLWWWAWHPAG